MLTLRRVLGSIHGEITRHVAENQKGALMMNSWSLRSG